MKKIPKTQGPCTRSANPGEQRYRWQDKQLARDYNLEIRYAALVAELLGIPSRGGD